MAKNNKYKKGGNTRLSLRTRARQSGSFSPIFFGNQQLGTATVRSINQIIKNMMKKNGGRDRLGTLILKEWKKVKKRMDKLIKEGYTFTGRLQDIYNGFLHNTQRELDFLSQMKTRELRVLSASYKGETNVQKKMDMLAEERRLRREEARRRKEEEDYARWEEEAAKIDIDGTEDEELEVPVYTDILKLQNIIGEELDYIDEIAAWDGYVDPLRKLECTEMANEILENLSWVNSDYSKTVSIPKEDIDAIIDFWENTGGLYEVIKQGENKYWGMFYDAARFNSDLLKMFGLTGVDLQEFAYGGAMSASDYHYNPATKDFDADVGLYDDQW